MSNWMPESGFDPRLRKYTCSHCGEFFFALASIDHPDEERIFKEYQFIPASLK